MNRTLALSTASFVPLSVVTIYFWADLPRLEPQKSFFTGGASQGEHNCTKVTSLKQQLWLLYLQYFLHVSPKLLLHALTSAYGLHQSAACPATVQYFLIMQLYRFATLRVFLKPS